MSKGHIILVAKTQLQYFHVAAGIRLCHS